MTAQTRVRPIRLASSALLILAMAFFVAECQRTQARWKGKIEKTDGITIVRNPLSPRFNGSVVSIEEELSIGGTSGDGEAPFGKISLIAVDGDGNIYIGDSKDKNINVVDKDGRSLRTLGRAGQGPGEFTGISGLEITPQNELMIYDRYASKLIFFSLAGRYLRTDVLAANWAGLIHKTKNGSFYLLTPDFLGRHESGDLRVAACVNEHAADLSFVRTLVKDRYWSAMSPLQPTMKTAFTHSDQIVCGYRDDYEIHVMNPNGKVIRKLFKEHTPFGLSEKEKTKRNLTKAGDLPDHFPAYEDIMVDDEGRIFTLLYEEPKDGKGYLFDVFSAEGIYIAKVILKAIPRCWEGGKLYTIEEDDSGYQYVKRYRVTWRI
jgi:6-bladed beta-propeller